jgi:DNA-binding NarL/FixJ family response regulator
MPTSPATVLVADLPGPSRSALANLIAATPELALAGSVSTLAELRGALRDDRPDVVLLDDRLFRGGRLRSWPFAARLVITGVDDAPAYALRARDLGAVWIAKERVEALLDALHAREPLLAMAS